MSIFESLANAQIYSIFAKIFNVDSKMDKFAYQFVEEDLESTALKITEDKATYVKSKRKTFKKI